MKHTLKVLLLCLLPLLGAGQGAITITLPRDVIREARLNAKLDSFAKALKEPVVVVPPVVVPEVPGLKDCIEGPSVSKISNVTPTSLLLVFHGFEVTKLQVTILDFAGRQVREQTFDPLSNQLAVTYTPLPAGRYKLIVKGLNCNGQDSVDFDIPDSNVGVIPPVVDDSKPTTIAKGLNDHLNLTWKKEGNGYLVSDISSPGIGSEYEFRYLIGSEVVKHSLKNYLIQSNAGRILKYKIKPSKVLNQWEPGDGYYDQNAGQTFSYNTSVAFNTFYQPSFTTDFVNPFPAKFNPASQEIQWGDVTDDFQLPKGHVYVADPRPWGIENAFRKGVTHISNFALPWGQGKDDYIVSLFNKGVTYNDVPRIETVFGIQKSGNSGALWPDNTSKDWWPKGAPTYEEGYQIGLKADISHALFIAEMSENESWLPPNSLAFKGFYDAYMPRLIAKHGEKALACHDYIWLGGIKLNTGLGRDYYKSILKMRPDQMPPNDYTPGGSLTKTNLIVETVYLGAPDNVTAQPYELIFRLNYIKQMGYTGGAFIAYVHEWKPNNMNEITYPEGKMYAHAKLPLDPNALIANGFLSQAFGKLFIEWGGGVKTPDKLLPSTWFGGAFFWFPTGATSPQGGFPHFKNTEGYPTYYGYNASGDITHFSQKLFADTYGKVEGGKDQYLKFRIDGGNWINANDEDYIDAYHDKRGFVHSRMLNGKTAFFYLNCFTDNKTHDLEVELPNGQKWTGKVAGNGVHVKLL